MRLTFVGTRGNIPLRSRLHGMHAAVVVQAGRTRLLIDCGQDWSGRLDRLHPAAILISHAHPDHAAGLKGGAPCGVYASAEAWRTMDRWPLTNRYVVRPGREFALSGVTVEAWPVEHSLLAPAVGYRLASGSSRIFYVPDIADLPRPRSALRDVDLYVGDGAVMDRSLVRRRGAVLTGHASVPTQLGWCAAAGVRAAVFTHCGSGIVRSNPRAVDGAVRALGREYGVCARIAFDGLVLTVRSDDIRRPS